MSAIGVLELVDHTSVELHLAEVEVVLGLVVSNVHLACRSVIVESPRDRRLDVDLPSLVGTKVPSEVEGSLGGHAVLADTLV